MFSAWTPCCSNVAPVEFEIELASVRHLNPQQSAENFQVSSESVELWQAKITGLDIKPLSGDASELVRLC